MSRVHAFAAVAICLVTHAAAQPASQLQRICALPEVLDTVTLELQRRGTAGTLDARNPGEVTEPDGSGASCSVWLVQPDINTNDPGPELRYRVVTQGYHVRRLANSLAVDLIN